MQQLATEIMEVRTQQKVEDTILVPLYVNLNAIGQERTYYELVQAVFGDILGFSQIEINNFKSQTKYQIVLILDGYDEIFNDSSQNISKNNNLNKWNCINLVIFTCRTQLLQNNTSHY